MDALVDTDWLARRLGEPGLVVADVRWYLDPARRGMGEEVDRPAEEDRVQKGDGGEGQVGQGQGDGQSPHRPQQPEDPAVDA